MTTLITVYVIVAILAGWVLRWLDQTACPCCDKPPANHGWLLTVTGALFWPVIFCTAIWLVLTERKQR